MFKAIFVDSIAGVEALERRLNDGWRIAQTNEFKEAVVYILIDEKKAKEDASKALKLAK